MSLKRRITKLEKVVRPPPEPPRPRGRLLYGLTTIVAFHAGGWKRSEAVADAMARGLGFTNSELKAALSAKGNEFSEALLAALNDLVNARIPETDFNGALVQLYGELPLELRERLSLPATFEELFQQP